MPDIFERYGSRAYLADIGRVAFVSVCAIGLAAVVLEFFAPGIVGNYVTSQHLVAAAAVAAALALIEPAPPADRRARAAYALAAALLIAFGAAALWRALAALPEAQLPVTFVAAAALLVAFIAYARPSGAR